MVLSKKKDARYMQFRITGDMRNQLREEAEQLGMTSAGLVSYVVGEWLYARRKFTQPVVENLIKDLLAKKAGEEGRDLFPTASTAKRKE